MASISWAPDGRRLGVTIYPGNPDRAAVRGDRNVGVLHEDGTVELLTSSDANDRAPRFSPGGGAIAYVSDESGRDEVYVLPYPGPGPRTIISNAGRAGAVLPADRAT
jgi:Tol biopolymer transport system component